MRFREDNLADLDRARTAVAQWREQNPAGTEAQLLAALGPQFHRDYTPVLRAVLFTHDRKSPPSPQAGEEQPGSPQAHPEPADNIRTMTVSREDQQLLYPIPKMTTFELTRLRRALEKTLAMETLPPYTRPREELSKDLADVIAEQDERERIRRANA